MRILRKLGYWIRARRHAADLAEEMEFHRSMMEGELARSGDADAADAARRSMGNSTLMREDSRAVWIAPWIESVFQDLRYAVRSLLHTPGFTLAAIGALVVGISLNTSLFAVFNAAVLRPWPVRDPARVIDLYHTPEPGGGIGFSIPEYRYMAEHAKTVAGLAAIRKEWVQFDNDSSAAHQEGHFVSGNYFDVLGVGMELGRGFLESEDRTDAPERVVVLSYRLWRSRFGGDRQMLGRTLRIDGTAFTVVGVAAEEFTGTHGTRHDLWLPLSSMALVRPKNEGDGIGFLTKPERCCSEMAARMAAGVTRAQAEAELTALSAQFAKTAGRKPSAIRATGIRFLDLPERRGPIVPAMILMMTAMGLVLLLACANVGNLLIARAIARQHEIAVRISIGASRSRVVRQMLTESATLAFAAGAVGLAAAYWLPAAVFTLSPEPPPFRVAPDGTVLLYTAVLSVAACLLFGLAPALHATRRLSGGIRREGARAEARFALRSTLLAIQVGLSIVLLVGAGLMTRGVERAKSIDPGFAVHNVAVTTIDLPANAYDQGARRAIFRQFSDAFQDRPELKQAGWAVSPPFPRSRGWIGFRLPNDPPDSFHRAFYNEVSGGFFAVLRIPVSAGRAFEPSDAGRGYVMVTESLARECWPGQDAVGKTIAQPPRQVIGVVKDASLVDLNTSEPGFFELFDDYPAPSVLTRTDQGGNTGQEIASIAKRIDPRIQVRTRPLTANVTDALQAARIGSYLAAMLGLIALLLAAVGISGMFAYAAQQRTKEIGIRAALGASRLQLIGLVLGSSARSLLIGVGIGLAGAAALSTMMRKFIYGVSNVDPLAYGAALLVMTIAAALASAIPARRASRVDPAIALRYE